MSARAVADEPTPRMWRTHRRLSRCCYGRRAPPSARADRRPPRGPPLLTRAERRRPPPWRRLGGGRAAEGGRGRGGEGGANGEGDEGGGGEYPPAGQAAGRRHRPRRRRRRSVGAWAAAVATAGGGGQRWREKGGSPGWVGQSGERRGMEGDGRDAGAAWRRRAGVDADVRRRAAHVPPRRSTRPASDSASLLPLRERAASASGCMRRRR